MPSRSELALPLLALTTAVLFVIGYGLVSPNIAFARAHASAWASALLVLPALGIFLVRAGRHALGQGWRLWWSAGWVLIVIHLYWGLGRLHGWDPLSVFERQGFMIAGPIFLLQAVWLIDILFSWLGRDWSEASGGYLVWQWFAWFVAAANFLVSLLIFRNDAASLWTGILLAIVLGLALLRRLIEGEPA